jgi:hypothetical protein
MVTATNLRLQFEEQSTPTRSSDTRNPDAEATVQRAPH